MTDDNVIKVDPAVPGKKTSEISGPSASEATVSMELMNANCYWNDKEYKLGQRVTDGNKSYECSFGRWLEVDDD